MTGRILAVIIFCSALCATFAFGANDAAISGTLKDPSGAPFFGAFVEVRNAKTKVSVNVPSDKQGHYRIQNLPPGEYDVRIRVTGYQADTRTMKVGTGEAAAADFSLRTSPVRWADLSIYQAKKLMPEGKGKELLTGQCFACHGFQTRMATTRRTLDGWKQ